MRKTGFHPLQLWLAGTTLAFALAALLVIPDYVQKERFGQLSEMTSKNAVLGRLWLTGQIGEWKATMKAARRSHMAASGEGAAPVDFKEFTGFVALTQSGVEPWQVAWSEKTSAFEYETSLNDSSFIQELIAGLKSEVEDSSANQSSSKAYFHWVPSGSKAITVAILESPLVSADGAKRTQVALVGFLPQASLDAATRYFRGGASELSILSQGGVLFADDDRAAVGEAIASSPLSDRVLRGKTNTFEGLLTNDSKAEFQVASETVLASNLIVLAKTPVFAISKATQNIKLVLIGLFGGLIFFMLLIGRAFVEGVRRKLNHLQEIAADLTSERAQKLKIRLNKDKDWAPVVGLMQNRPMSGDAAVPVVSEVSELSSPATPVTVLNRVLSETPSAKVELESLEQAGQYISQCLREPIAASIGHLKLARTKTVEVEATKHLEHVETEVRRIKELIEKVQKLGVYKALQTKPTDVSAVMRDLIEDLSVMAETVGVKVRKSLYPVPKARIAQQDFREALKVLIQERVFASQAQGRTEIVVGVEPSGSQVIIRIEDRCSSMNDIECENFFRPFHQKGSYDHQHQKMLAILNYHDLKIRLEPQATGGNLILLELPAVEEAMMEFVPEAPRENASNQSEPRLEDSIGSDLWELSKGQTQLGAVQTSSLNFLESKKVEAEKVATLDAPNEQIRRSRRTEVAEEDTVTSGPLSEYSVKVRKPRLNVPLE